MSLVIDLIKSFPSRRGNMQFKYKLIVNNGTVFGISGASGSGKSTLLRTISGLESNGVQGKINLNNQDWFSDKINCKPQQRKVGFVFQEGGLFPHLTVLENLKLTNASTSEISDLLQKAQLKSIEQSEIQWLSGGQYQMVMICRAILQNPSVLLLDEPFSALDPENKTLFGKLLKNYVKDNSIPCILVTHSKADLLALCDTQAYMLKNELVQVESNLKTTDL